MSSVLLLPQITWHAGPQRAAWEIEAICAMFCFLYFPRTRFLCDIVSVGMTYKELDGGKKGGKEEKREWEEEKDISAGDLICPARPPQSRV